MRNSWSKGVVVLFVAVAALADPPEGKEAEAQPSPSQSMNNAREFLGKMANADQRVSELKAIAIRKKDVIKLTCVNDKLTRIRGHLSLGKQTATALEEAIGRSDEEERKHEYTRMSILFQKVLVLATEAEGCVGEDVSYVGTTKVEEEISPSIPEADTVEPSMPLPDVEDPPPASPFV